jgi:Type I restriction enzyme R protein N terminus (HSDR_N)
MNPQNSVNQANQGLNLPTFNYKCKEIDGKMHIFDVIRRKFLVLTPEEWVRQHFVNLLITHYKYPKSLIRIEGGLHYHKLQKRSDIVVYNIEGKPFLLVECKSSQVPVNQAVIEQASRYNLTMKAPFLAVTNGLNTFCFEVNFEENSFKQMKALPKFSEL